jgi:hypothetical protein
MSNACAVVGSGAGRSSTRRRWRASAARCKRNDGNCGKHSTATTITCKRVACPCLRGRRRIKHALPSLLLLLLRSRRIQRVCDGQCRNGGPCTGWPYTSRRVRVNTPSVHTLSASGRRERGRAPPWLPLTQSSASASRTASSQPPVYVCMCMCIHVSRHDTQCTQAEIHLSLSL